MEVCDSDDPNRVIQIDEHHSVYDWAFGGVASKPSAANIEQILKERGVCFRRLDSADLNTGSFKYDWSVGNTGNRIIGNRRFWICKKDGSDAQIINTTHKIEPVKIKQSKLNISPQIINTNTIQIQNNKPKVALCLSGHLRTFDRTFQSLLLNVSRTLS